MPTKKSTTIELTELTFDTLGEMARIQKEIGDDLDKSGKRTKTTTKERQDKQTKDFVKKTAQNPAQFVISTLKTTIPQLGIVIAGTAIIASILKQINEIQARFTEDVDKRINIALSNAEQARVDANLQQVIITNGDGSTNPRNVYNSLNESDANVSISESRYSMENTSGYE